MSNNENQNEQREWRAISVQDFSSLKKEIEKLIREKMNHNLDVKSIIFSENGKGGTLQYFEEKSVLNYTIKIEKKRKELIKKFRSIVGNSIKFEDFVFYLEGAYTPVFDKDVSETDKEVFSLNMVENYLEDPEIVNAFVSKVLNAGQKENNIFDSIKGIDVILPDSWWERKERNSI